MATILVFRCDEVGCGAESRCNSEQYASHDSAPPPGWTEVVVRIASMHNPKCAVTRLLCASCTTKLAAAVSSVGVWLRGHGVKTLPADKQ